MPSPQRLRGPRDGAMGSRPITTAPDDLMHHIKVSHPFEHGAILIAPSTQKQQAAIATLQVDVSSARPLPLLPPAEAAAGQGWRRSHRWRLSRRSRLCAAAKPGQKRDPQELKRL